MILRPRPTPRASCLDLPLAALHLLLVVHLAALLQVALLQAALLQAALLQVVLLSIQHSNACFLDPGFQRVMMRQLAEVYGHKEAKEGLLLAVQLFVPPCIPGCIAVDSERDCQELV